MTKRTQHEHPRPYSISHAAILRRLTGAHGRGSELAALAWFFIVARTPYDGSDRPTWMNNETLSHDLGLGTEGLRRTERAIARLRDASMLTTHTGKRPRTAARSWGRIIVPDLAGQVRVIVPKPGAMTNIWIVCRGARPNPCNLVTAMVGAHIMAAHALGRCPDEWAPIGTKAADLRRFVGASKGSTWGRRVNDLCDLGLLERRKQLWVAPPHEWYTAWRAIHCDMMAR